MHFWVWISLLDIKAKPTDEETIMKHLLVVAAVAVAILFVWNRPAWAVDGYKQFKFGMSEGEVRATKVCNFIRTDVQDLECSDFTFAGQRSVATFYFIDGKLLQVTFVLGEKSKAEMKLLILQLYKKYGAFKEISLAKESDEFGSSDRDIAMGFDGNTVMLYIMRLPTRELAMLIYKSPQYEQEAQKQKAEALKKDL